MNLPQNRNIKGLGKVPSTAVKDLCVSGFNPWSSTIKESENWERKPALGTSGYTYFSLFFPPEIVLIEVHVLIRGQSVQESKDFFIFFVLLYMSNF